MKLSPPQKIGIIIFTLILGCVIVYVGLITSSRFLSNLPKAPDLTTGTGRTAESIKQEIDNYKTISSIIKENQSYLNDLLIVKFIKPLFDSLLVAIIAYLFGEPLITAFAERIKVKKQ
jgi:predicted PurR-regulated permease PerM